MSASLLHALVSTAATSSVAILLVGLLRKPLRMAVGARAAYWLWLLVPATAFAALLPAPSQAVRVISASLPSGVSAVLSSVATMITPSHSSAYVFGALVIWATGAVIMFTLLLSRQRSFVQSLGRMTSDADGVRRSGAIVAPMLIGAWRSRVVVPIDFEIRYGEEERQLTLAHERAHLARRDILVNAFAAIWLCLAWFNPLMYWAIGRLRLDQELACDASVLARSKTPPRRYADALLNTQLATQSAWRMPIGCDWQSCHPLKERIVTLKRPLPGLSRQMLGITFALAMTISGGYAAWAAQQVTGTPILVDLKLTVTGVAADVFSASTEYIVNAGERPAFLHGRPYNVRCTAFLPNAPGNSSASSDQKASGVDVSGQISLECTIGHNGTLVATPAVITRDGESATVHFKNPPDLHDYQLDIVATTSKEKIEAAKIAAASRKSPQ
jgi:bla regulator protein blaR1